MRFHNPLAFSEARTEYQAAQKEYATFDDSDREAEDRAEKRLDAADDAFFSADAYPQRKVGSVELTPEQYDRYVEQAGKLAHDRLTDLVTGAGWKALDDEERAKAAKKVVDSARKEVRGNLFGGGKAADESGSSGWDEFTPVGLKAQRSAWDEFAPAKQADVVSDLERLIPGVGMTSGFRTPEYQADMRARGYRPARNSGHLDGSSLDLTPPRGKSMAWLKTQVKRYRGDARLLNEGDHLHVTFPGWYGAPVLGGARSAGLINPMAER